MYSNNRSFIAIAKMHYVIIRIIRCYFDNIVII